MASFWCHNRRLQTHSLKWSNVFTVDCENLYEFINVFEASAMETKLICWICSKLAMKTLELVVKCRDR